MKLAAIIALVLAFGAGAARAETRAGYCQGGTFLNLEVGQNLVDARYADATPAYEVQDTGALTCTPPPQIGRAHV